MKLNGYLVAGVLLLASLCALPAFATITFQDGFWSSSFMCDDWVHDYPSTLDCDGWETDLDVCAGGADSIPCAGTDQSRGESILSSHNHAAGVSDSGAQVHYFYTGADGQGVTNDRSGGLILRFPRILQEYWLRFYIYYPEEMAWGVAQGWKTIYFDNEGSNAGWYFGLPLFPDSASFYFQTNETRVGEHNGYGNDWLESNQRQGFGRWIPVEIHFKNDTDGTDGVVQVWIDDVLVTDVHDHDFGHYGFEMMEVGSNGNAAIAHLPSAINKAVAIRLDDFAVALPSYNGFVDDGSGNLRIGLVGGTPPDPEPTIPRPPSSLQIDD